MQPEETRAETIEETIARCLQGDQSGYADLYNQYAAGVLRLCNSLLMNQQDAEDVVQESFVYAFKNLHRYDPNRASFKTWLYTIAVSRSRNVYRRKQPVLVELSNLLRQTLPGPNTDTPEAAMTRTEVRDAVLAAISGLSPRLREAVVLRYGHGLTYREMAEVLGCPQKTAESRVRLAHDNLRGQLNSVGQGLLEELLRI